MDLQKSAEVVDKIKAELDRIQSDVSASVEEVAEAQEKLRLALIEEEVFWQQKNTVIWLMAGDQNMLFPCVYEAEACLEPYYQYSELKWSMDGERGRD